MTNKEIQVNEYVRTKLFGIAKVTYIDKNIFIYKTGRSNITEKYEGQNHSFNLIDLIEVGDYVNGIRVDAKTEGYIIFFDGDGDIELFASDIKTIVTKEQFKAMEYKVGGEDD